MYSLLIMCVLLNYSGAKILLNELYCASVLFRHTKKRICIKKDTLVSLQQLSKCIHRGEIKKSYCNAFLKQQGK